MNSIEVKIGHAGYCHNIEAISMQGGKWSKTIFPALFALLKHPQHGYILFDTGYSEHFFKETEKFPYSVYAQLTPVVCEKEEHVISQLQSWGIDPHEIRYIIISHFHADHIAGLKDFPNATFICSKKGYEFIRNKKGIVALKQAFIPDLLPVDFENRVRYFEECDQVDIYTNESVNTFFPKGYDIFHDGSILSVCLEGHADHQYGIFLCDQNNTEYFFIADATWSSEAYRENKKPHLLAHLVIHDKKKYYENFNKIHLLHKECPNLIIVPSHCSEFYQKR